MYGYQGQQFSYQQPRDELKFVNGIESAMAYQMPPNSKVLLMDQNIARFYLKQTDASGMASVKAYDFVEAAESKQEFLTREEFEERMSYYESLIPKQSSKAKSSRVHADDDSE